MQSNSFWVTKLDQSVDMRFQSSVNNHLIINASDLMREPLFSF